MVALRSRIKFPLQAGFTLVEMSIVLVIIGLIIGGVLVGRDLINAATIRSQISQIEKYNAAVNTFRGKYGYLPGDIPNAQAFGFSASGSYAGSGDGDGVIESPQCASGAYTPQPVFQDTGEAPTVWVDLSQAGLISGGFNTASRTSQLNSDLIGSAIGTFFPQAAIGQGNYVYVWSQGAATAASPTGDGQTLLNYFGVSKVSKVLDCSNGGYIYWDLTNGSNEGMTVAQAYAIDSKMDDGNPITGRVTASGLMYGNYPGWAAVRFFLFTQPVNPSATTCFDDSNTVGSPWKYSMQVNNGAGLNCALSFQFQ